jgi:hypothetical protein
VGKPGKDFFGDIELAFTAQGSGQPTSTRFGQRLNADNQAADKTARQARSDIQIGWAMNCGDNRRSATRLPTVEYVRSLRPRG